MPTFKVGDKIKQLKECNGNKAGEVYEVHDGNKIVNFKDELYAWSEKTTGFGCSCQGWWELVSEPTLETLEVGMMVHSSDKYIRRVLTAQGEGEYRVYGLSHYKEENDNDYWKKFAYHCTAFELKKKGYTVFSPPTPPTDLVEIDGKKYRKADVTERLSELEEVKE